MRTTRLFSAALFMFLTACACAGTNRSLSLVPGNIAFGSVPVGSRVSQAVTVTNSGTKPVQLTSLSLSGGSVFSLYGWTGPVTLAPSKSVSLTVSFSPSAVASYSATIAVSGTASVNALIGLTGSGTGTASSLVTISPTTAAVQTLLTQQFTASVSGTTNTGVSWSVNGVLGGNSAAGTISSSGLYTAPASVPSGGSVVIAATLLADTSKTSSSVVTILAAPTPIDVSISPITSTLQTGATQQFTASVSGTSNTGVAWSVNGVQGGSAAGGTISSTGLYTAPASPPSGGVATVTATSVYSSSSSAQAAVNIVPSSHYVMLSWLGSSSAVSGYNVYRSSQATGPFTLLNSSLNSGTTYTDTTVQAGQTYYYTISAVSSGGMQSSYSNVAQANIP